jgi:hypothetical protein
MGLYKVAQLNQFREISHCTACVHFSGCAVWLSLLLMNEELGHPGLDIIVPDITKPCPMFFAWTSEAARKYGREGADR